MEAHERGAPPRVSVVIPTRNEARNIAHVLATLPSDLHEVLVVDGASTDGTVEVALEARPDIRVVQQPGTGKGDALAAGLAACTGDVVIMLDADGSADGREIPRFVDALIAGADYAKGSRFLDGGGSSDLTWVRRTGNRFLCAVVNMIHRTRFSDLCYGYNAAWVAQLRRLDLDCPGFEIETVMNIRSARSNLRITEVPSFESPRMHGNSNLNAVRDGWRVLRAILRERRGAVVAVPLADGVELVAPLETAAVAVGAAALQAAAESAPSNGVSPPPGGVASL